MGNLVLAWLYLCLVTITPIIYIQNEQMSLTHQQELGLQHADSLLNSESSSHCEPEESYTPQCRRSGRRAPNTPPMAHPPRVSKKYNESFWEQSQNLAYMRFLQEFGGLFNSGWRERKSLKINVLMSNHIKTRSPLQCRSHHQKMMKFHNSIPQIIAHLNKFADPPSAPQIQNHQPELLRFQQTEAILLDLSEKVRWAEEEQDLWDRIMCQECMSGTDEN